MASLLCSPKSRKEWDRWMGTHVGKGKVEGLRWLSRLKGVDEMPVYPSIPGTRRVRGAMIHIGWRRVMKASVWLYLLLVSSVYMFFGDGLKDMAQAAKQIALVNMAGEGMEEVFSWLVSE